LEEGSLLEEDIFVRPRLPDLWCLPRFVELARFDLDDGDFEDGDLDDG
jgi:hypothetical protein